MVVLVLGLEVPLNHIGINDEYTLGSSFGSFDGMTYRKTCRFIARIVLKRRKNVEIVV